MAEENPFVSDPANAEIWELGYTAGFAEPESDHFLPLAPDLLEIYGKSELAGRDDRRRLPSGDPADDNTPRQWVEIAPAVIEFTSEPFLLPLKQRGCNEVISSYEPEATALTKRYINSTPS